MSEEIQVKKYCGCGRLEGHSETCEFRESTEICSSPIEIVGAPETKEITTTLVEASREVSTEITEPLDVKLVALNRQQMQSCQASISSWIEQKISHERQTCHELNQNLEIAVRNRWRSYTLKSNVDRLKKSIVYYQKMKDAVDAGYTIIPDIPMDIFAVRVTRQNPLKNEVTANWDNRLASQQRSDLSESGKGKYVAFNAHRGWRTVGKDKEGNDLRKFENDQFREVVFPLVAVKPEIMSATEEAMALKIFDQIGICPPTGNAVVEERRTNQDPMIIGRIIGNVNGYKSRKQCSFLIGWFINTKSL